ncbi:MAG: VWA domain-containing protein [Rhodoglobus sp.]
MRRSPKRNWLLATIGAAVSVVLLSGCIGEPVVTGDGTGTLPDDPSTIRILAGSEVKDMIPILESAASEIGVKVAFDYVGTLEGTELVASGGADGKYDATWFPNNKYLSLLPGATSKISTSVKIMQSPVVLGLKAAVAKKLGWDTEPPTWVQVAQAAADGEFSYGMTNPAASNSGFSTLVAVATALANTGTALTDADVTAVTPDLTRFFSGQKLTSGSSGFLASTFVADPSRVDGIFNYESVLMTLDTPTPLTLITPTDGVLTSDYPLTLLTSAAGQKRDLFTKLTDWLTTPKIQTRIVDETSRRPAVPGIDTGGKFGDAVLFEQPFPNTLDVVNGLISAYLETARPPAQTTFVLDTSGSMDGDRLDSLKQALKNLAGADTSTTGGFAQFRSRERVTLIPFSDRPESPTVIEVPEGDKTEALQKIVDITDSLNADGGTAIYDSLEEAYRQAAAQLKENPDTFNSIVLMTDGENTDGDEASDFRDFYESLGSSSKTIPTFVVLFGDGNVDELTDIATLTGGKVFDARSGSGLAGAFQEIRGYQ